MPRKSVPVVPSESELTRLQEWLRAGSTPQQVALRCRIILAAAQGQHAWLHESHTPHVPTPESVAKWKHLDAQKQVYAAVITGGDNAGGKILDALEAAGVADHTIVKFSSDNGPESTAAKAGPKKRDPDASVTG